MMRPSLVCRAANSIPLARHLDELETLGYTIVSDLFTRDELTQMQTDYSVIQSKAVDIIASVAPLPRVWTENNMMTKSRYWKKDENVILQAGEGRYDLWKGFNTGFFSSSSVVNNTKLEPILSRCLVDNYAQYNGVILSYPGSGDQYFHRDTDTLSNVNSGGAALMAVDDFYFTCLIPVTGDTTPENGPTEFLAGSHRKTAEEFYALQSTQVCVPLGSALLFNGKINHRGIGNRSKSERSVIYSVYHKRWYNDQFRMGVDE